MSTSPHKERLMVGAFAGAACVGMFALGDLWLGCSSRPEAPQSQTTAAPTGPTTAPDSSTGASTSTGSGSAIAPAMRALATDLAALQGALAVSRLGDSDRARALAALDGLEQKARALKEQQPSAPHPLLAAGLPAFVADVGDARVALRREPPDTEPALKLARSCRACHALAQRAPDPADVAVDSGALALWLPTGR